MLNININIVKIDESRVAIKIESDTPSDKIDELEAKGFFRMLSETGLRVGFAGNDSVDGVSFADLSKHLGKKVIVKESKDE